MSLVPLVRSGLRHCRQDAWETFARRRVRVGLVENVIAFPWRLRRIVNLVERMNRVPAWRSLLLPTARSAILGKRYVFLVFGLGNFFLEEHAFGRLRFFEYLVERGRVLVLGRFLDRRRVQ